MRCLPVLSISGLEGQPAGDVIDVVVEHDDGYIAIARWDKWRVCVNTGGDVFWERRVRTPGEWAPAKDAEVVIPVVFRKSIVRAAHAGLVACGALGAR
jgi:hypothetical protein